jgi:hypothetical protein
MTDRRPHSDTDWEHSKAVLSDLSFVPANSIKNYIKEWMKMEDFDFWCLNGSIRHESLRFPEIMIECGRRKRMEHQMPVGQLKGSSWSLN